MTLQVQQLWTRDRWKEVFAYEPHEGQRQFHDSTKRFRILACGSRWGKSRAAALEGLYDLFKDSNRRGWIVAPTYELASKVFHYVIEFMLSSPVTANMILRHSEHDLYLQTKTLSEIKGKSADNPDSLLGEALDFVILDEAPSISREVWEIYLRPRLVDRKGWAAFIGTPKGRNWFYEMYVRGQDPLDKDYQSWNFPTIMNTKIENIQAEIERARQDMPERAFKQEFLAEFLSDAGGVFRGVRECVKGALAQPLQGRNYVMGVDLAKYQDFTVLTVMDRATRQVVHWDRFSQIDWNLQKLKITETAKRFNDAQVFIDSTGVGDPIFEDLVRAGVKATGYKIVTGTKQALIDSLVMAIEGKTIGYPELPQLLNELEIYEYEMTRAGNVRMNAPSGYHDDCVISLALAVYGLGRGGGSYLAGIGEKEVPGEVPKEGQKGWVVHPETGDETEWR